MALSPYSQPLLSLLLFIYNKLNDIILSLYDNFYEILPLHKENLIKLLIWSAILPTKQVNLPILMNILIQAEASGVRLVATNLEMSKKQLCGQNRGTRHFYRPGQNFV